MAKGAIIMQKIILTFVVAALLSLSACGWKPSAQPVAITEPWASMNLPVKENAVVWASTDKQFKAVHKEGRAEIGKAYLAALAKAGWKMTKQDMSSQDYFDFEKGGEKIVLEVYDFENTGVIIDKK